MDLNKKREIKQHQIRKVILKQNKNYKIEKTIKKSRITQLRCKLKIFNITKTFNNNKQ